MIRDMGMRIVHASDPRVVSRRRARSFQTRIAPRHHSCCVWPDLVPYTCLSCRREHVGDPRRAGFGPRHDWWYCAAQRAKRARES